MKIDIYNFKSAITAIEPELLSDEYASEATNLETVKGSIEPLKDTLSSDEISVTSSTNSLTRLSVRDGVSKMIQGVNKESFVTSPLAQDDFDRVYLTSDSSEPKMGSYSSIETTKIPLGIDAPSQAISLGHSFSGDDIQQTSFLFVEESAYGELSAPSPATTPIMVQESGTITLNMPTAPSSGHWTNRRIYMSDYAGNFLYLKTIPSTYSHTIIEFTGFDFASLGEELDQISEGALNDKPRAGMTGLCEMPGGFLAGYEDNVVCFSKQYLPHAWPSNFEITINGVIKRIAVAASGLVVLTDKKPYLVAGGSPEAMYPVELDISEPLYSPNAVVDMGSYVVYPSSDGLIAVAGQENRNLINGVMDKDEWRNHLSSSAVACTFNGKYWYFTNNGGFVFDVESGSFSRNSMSAVACYSDQINDKIYLVTPTGALETYSRSNLTNNTFTWVSKTFSVDGQSISCFKVDSKANVNVTIEYVNKGEVINTYNVVSEPYNASRLPSVRCQSIIITVSSNDAVKRIQVASSMQELG